VLKRYVDAAARIPLLRVITGSVLGVTGVVGIWILRNIRRIYQACRGIAKFLVKMLDNAIKKILILNIEN
jgi:hypothetical protein